jgi:hypothetical protein
MKIIRVIFEIFGGLIIVASTTLGSGLISFVVYLKWENAPISVALLVIGFIAGVIWAVKIWKKYGTLEWLSGIRKIS